MSTLLLNSTKSYKALIGPLEVWIRCLRTDHRHILLCSASLNILCKENRTATATTPSNWSTTTFPQLSSLSTFKTLATATAAASVPYQSKLEVGSGLESNKDTVIHHSLRQYCSEAVNIFHKFKAVMEVPEGIFRGSVDRFHGITVRSADEFDANTNFPDKLEKSLQFWSSNKNRAIWFKVNTEHSSWIPELTRKGFDFHHAKSGHVVMCRWLPQDEYMNLPAFAHTMIGVGGLVVNDRDEVLVVSDRFAMIPNSWKLPGGFVDPGEYLVDAVIREVREETSVETKFRTVVSIRQSHGGSFDCSDLYIVIALEPLTLNLERCEREISRIKWMPIKEYLEHPNVHETNRHFMRTYLYYKERGLRFSFEIGKHQILKKEYCLYYLKDSEPNDAEDYCTCPKEESDDQPNDGKNFCTCPKEEICTCPKEEEQKNEKNI